jgi:hypothetical protein
MSVVRSGTEAKIRVFESFGLAVATVFHFAIESRQVTLELSRVNPVGGPLDKKITRT